MIPEIGVFCLILAFVFACVQAFFGLAKTRIGQWLIAPLAGLQCITITASFGILIYARVTLDFSVANVVDHASRSLPLLYRISGSWGNHEGSMLLWVWVLAVFGALLSGSERICMELKNTALGVQAVLSAGFLLFILFTSNPFERVFPPAMDGKELNPLLQDIGLAIHPPLLYGGYVGFSIVFSLAVAGLLRNDTQAGWAKAAHPWIAGSWGFLTLGIGMGSWWAYRELGWGGFWFWDPVENASLLPWLAGTALLHSNIALKKRKILSAWVLLLSILTFSLSLLGTFLVRSGVLTSVHSFASDPTRGLFILAYIFLTTGGALLLYAIRPPGKDGSGKELLNPVSREGMIVINNLFLVTACLTVLLGTLYPLFADTFSDIKLTVGAPYFNATMLPLMVIPLFLAAIAPFIPWGYATLRRAGRALISSLLAAFISAVAVLLIGHTGIVASAGFALAAWLGIASLTIIARRVRLFKVPLKESLRLCKSHAHAILPVSLAHFGAALLVAGVTASSAWKSEADRHMRVGNTLMLAGLQFNYLEEHSFTRSNHTSTQTVFSVQKNGHEITRLMPEYRQYGASGTATSEVALYSRPWYDIYAVIGENLSDGTTAVRIYINPMMHFIWGGFICMAAGAFISLYFRKKT